MQKYSAPFRSSLITANHCSTVISTDAILLGSESVVRNGVYVSYKKKTLKHDLFVYFGIQTELNGAKAATTLGNYFFII